ncbi:MAG: hypothetical protein JO288_04550 [Hyphomicrobiales bacterium]|nr:hypothetical protein [Hyphomicrobiales bacterium]
MPLSNPKAFFDAIRASLYNGSLPQSAVDNINLILGAWDMFFPGTDYRFVACSLGTAFNQVGASLTPIDEIGQGAGHSYGTPTGPYNQVYFGRGYVQLTFLANYETADKRLHTIAPPGAKAPILSASQKLV